MRSRGSRSPSTTFWSARSRRRRNASHATRMSEISATPPAASAAMPAVEVNSCIEPNVSDAPDEPSALEDRRVALLVVVEVDLARDLRHRDVDRDRLADRRGLAERDAGLGLLSLRGLVD